MRLALAALLVITCSLPLAAASAKDLVGTWALDVEATWSKLQALPEVKALPPEAAEIAKSAFLTQGAGMVWVFTEDRVTSTVNGVKQEETYIVLTEAGDTLTTESTAADGKKERSTIRLIDGGMVLTPESNPLAKVVLKRR